MKIYCYSSICNLQDGNNLGDGTNDIILSSNILDCKTYCDVIDKVNYDIVGTYTPQEIGKERLQDAAWLGWCFNPGVLKHEEQHLIDKMVVIADTINKINKELNKKYEKDSFPCPENIINALFHNDKDKTKNLDLIIASIMNNDDIANKYFDFRYIEYNERYELLRMALKEKYYNQETNILSIPITELRADKNASPTFQKIKENLQNWVKAKEYLRDCQTYEGK